MIQFIRPKVCIIGSGWVTSAGALIFVGAELEDRYCLPNTPFLLHHPSGVTGGSASDMEISAEQIRHMRSRFDHLFAQTTRQTIARIRTDTQRDFWFNTTQARDYGLVGWVIASASELS
jgi:ATP-dependent Clp protease protease subunit